MKCLYNDELRYVCVCVADSTRIRLRVRVRTYACACMHVRMCEKCPRMNDVYHSLYVCVRRCVRMYVRYPQICVSLCASVCVTDIHKCVCVWVCMYGSSNTTTTTYIHSLGMRVDTD